MRSLKVITFFFNSLCDRLSFRLDCLWKPGRNCQNLLCYGNQSAREFRLGILAYANSDSGSAFRDNAIFLLPSFLSECCKTALRDRF